MIRFLNPMKILAVLLLFGFLFFYARMMLFHETSPPPPSLQRIHFGCYDDTRRNTVLTQDFSLHFNMVCHIWERTVERPYTAQGQLEIARCWIGHPSAIMPSAYTPTFALLLAPLTRLDAQTAYGIWMTASLALGALTFLILLSHPRGLSSRGFLIAVSILISTTTLRTVWAGQTALLTSFCFLAGIALLMDFDTATPRGRPLWNDVLLGILFFLTTFKPQIGLVFLAMLAGFRAWKAILFGFLGILSACLIVAPALGGWPEWIKDYLHLLTRYHSSGLDSGFILPCNFYQTSSLAAFFVPLKNSLSEAWMSRTFGGILLFLLTGSTVYCLQSTSRLRFLELVPRLVFAILFFAPHLQESENILLLLLVPFFQKKLSGIRFTATLFLLVIIFNQPEMGDALALQRQTAYQIMALGKLLLWGIWETTLRFSPQPQPEKQS